MSGTQNPAPNPQEAAFAEREAALDARTAELDARETVAHTAQFTAFVEVRIDEGRVLPGRKPELIALFSTLAAADVAELSFADGDGKTITSNPVETLKSILSDAPKAVEFGQIVGEDAISPSSVSFAAADGSSVDQERLEIHNKALAFQTQNPGTEYLDAVRAVS